MQDGIMATVSRRGNVLKYADPSFHQEWRHKAVAEYWSGKPQPQTVAKDGARRPSEWSRASSSCSSYPSTAATSRRVASSVDGTARDEVAEAPLMV